MLTAQSNEKVSGSLALNPPPYTPVEPVVERLHGVEVVDPYRWLEDQNSTRTKQWLAEQGAHTRAYLSAIPGRGRIRKRVAELLDVETVSEPRKVGDRYFYLKRTAGQEQPVIMMREGNGGTEVLLIDPAEIGQGSSIAANILCVSNDGKLLAYSVRRGGEDSCEIRFLNIEQRQVLPDKLPTGFCRGLAFFPDARGFFYVHRPIGTPRPYYRVVLRHFFGTDFESDTEIFFAGEHPQLHLGLSASPNGRLLGYSVTHADEKCRVDFFVHDITSSRPPQRIVERMEGLFVPAFVQNGLVALTDWNAPNGRIVSIDLDHPSPDAWRQIVPEAPSRIRDFVVVGDLIFVGYVEDLETRIAMFTCEGERCGTLPCPGGGTARLLPVQANTDVLFYRHSSFAQPPAIFCYRTQTREQRLWANSQIQLVPSSFEVRPVRYPSKDRAIVPMFLVSRKGNQGGGPLPTFLTGYGGFGTSVTPQFTAYATFLIEHGCLFAVANVRGGSELGQEWHEAGKRHNRQNAIDDFIAAAEWLISEGLADPARIAIGGGSNAGLLMAAALTQRPELFRAVICLGPLLDMLRYQLFDSANVWVDEYGTAENETDFHTLFAYSPYHRIRKGSPYPAILLISGDADTRCNPMHARKMAAGLQAATSAGRPILLDYNPAWGHTPVQPLTRRIEALTDRLAFIAHELGLEV